jgi:hypothetical protein
MKSGPPPSPDVSAFPDMHVSAFDGLTGQHLLTLPRRVPRDVGPGYNSGPSDRLVLGSP